MPLSARPVDPRDVRWENEQPVFRVHLWRRPALEGLSEEQRSHRGWHCSEWELTGTDVQGVLAWTDQQALSYEAAEVWVVVDVPGSPGKGMIRLRGHNPTVSADR